MIQQIRRITASSIEEVNRFIIDACEAFSQLLKDPILNRQRITATLSAVDVVIAHNLGRVPQNVSVVALNANAVVWQSAAATSSTITMRASAACTVSLEVY